jgi:predicted ArsR family transcriptional regulator
MFGLALRRYQRKVNRLRESVSFSERTLWQAVLELVTERGSMTRAELAESFKRDEETDVAAVLNDLVASGLLYSTGRGRSAAYRSTSQSDREHLAAERTLETLTHLVWLSLAVPGGLRREELAQRFPEQAATLDAALAALLEDGRAERLVDE